MIPINKVCLTIQVKFKKEYYYLYKKYILAKFPDVIKVYVCVILGNISGKHRIKLQWL